MSNFLHSTKGKILLCLICCLLLLLLMAFSRIQTLLSITKIKEFPDNYNLYSMEIHYDYDIDRMAQRGIKDTQSFVDAAIKESMPLLPITIKVPTFGCSALHVTGEDGHQLMGRNYDFKNNTSAMLIYTHPKKGYKSVSTVALDNTHANNPETSLYQKLTCLTAPFSPLDGLNEKGLGIAILALDTEPIHQQTGKPTITTSMAVRLILDKCATIDEAVALLKQYDMLALKPIDCHLYLTDATGAAKVIEYHPETKEIVVADTDVITNFLYIFKEKVTNPHGKNGIYGHGKDRYDKIKYVLNTTMHPMKVTVRQALQAAQQNPNPKDLTSNTQWSIVYDNTDLSADIYIRRQWEKPIHYKVKDQIKKEEK